MSDVLTLLPALPLTVDESNALAGEGTLSAALAVQGWRFVQCSHGSIPAADWHEHTHDFTQVGPDADEVEWIERVPDLVHDCVLIL